MKRIAFFTALLIVVAALAMGCGLADIFNPGTDLSPEAITDMKNAMNLILRKFDTSVDGILNAEDYVVKREKIVGYQTEAEEYYSAFKILFYGVRRDAPEDIVNWKNGFLKRFDDAIARLDVIHGISETTSSSPDSPYRIARMRTYKLVDIPARFLR